MKIRNANIYPMKPPYLPKEGDHIILLCLGGAHSTDFEFKKYRDIPIPEGTCYFWMYFPEEELESHPFYQKYLDDKDYNRGLDFEQEKWGQAELAGELT